MKLETIYNELKSLVKDNEFNLVAYLKLVEKLEKAIREETAYSTTSRTRVNAIKRVASPFMDRPVLTGYSNQEGYQIVTDSYHLIAIHQENMPLKLVTDNNDIADKIGHENVIYGNYPNMNNILKYTTENELPPLNLDDLTLFCKLHKKDNELYTIGNQNFNPHYVKDIIDVLGSNYHIYYQGENRPLFFVNSDDEIGLVLPVRVY